MISVIFFKSKVFSNSQCYQVKCPMVEETRICPQDWNFNYLSEFSEFCLFNLLSCTRFKRQTFLSNKVILILLKA